MVGASRDSRLIQWISKMRSREAKNEKAASRSDMLCDRLPLLPFAGGIGLFSLATLVDGRPSLGNVAQ